MGECAQSRNQWLACEYSIQLGSKLQNVGSLVGSLLPIKESKWGLHTSLPRLLAPYRYTYTCICGLLVRSVWVIWGTSSLTKY